MFERDCRGHLRRHGLKIETEQVLGHFVPGKKDTPLRSGAYPPIKQPARKRTSRKKPWTEKGEQTSR